MKSDATKLDGGSRSWSVSLTFGVPWPDQTHTYFLKKSLCLAVVFKLLAIGLEICLMAKLANLNNGNAPTTMAGRFGQLLRHVHDDENLPGGVFHLAPINSQANNTLKYKTNTNTKGGINKVTDIAFSTRLHTKLYKFG